MAENIDAETDTAVHPRRRSAYSLHPQVNPYGNQAIKVPLLTSSNLHSWKKSMQSYLASIGLFNLVKNDLEPEKDDKSHNLWATHNELALSLLNEFVHESFQSNFEGITIAREHWTKATMDRTNKLARVRQQQLDFNRLDPCSLTPDVFISKTRSYLATLHASDLSVSEEHKLRLVLGLIPDSLPGVVQSLNLLVEPTIESVLSHVDTCLKSNKDAQKSAIRSIKASATGKNQKKSAKRKPHFNMNKNKKRSRPDPSS